MDEWALSIPVVAVLLLATIYVLLSCVKRERVKRMRKLSGVRAKTKSQQKYKAKVDDSAQRLDSQVAVSDSSGTRPPKPAPSLHEKLNFNTRSVLEKAFKDKKLLNRLLISGDRLKLDEVIGHGEFGVVYKGILYDANHSKRRPVAVKTVYGPSCTEESVHMFIKESARMVNFSNPYVLSLIAVIVKDNRPCIILPYMENGDLHSYIYDRTRVLTVADLVQFGYDVARGMAYLSGKKFIHRDLATRNCMVSDNKTVKVADFGLSRDLYESDYYRMSNIETPLPIRWVALESILTGKFTTKSDVWSFGVLLWELITRGLNPYPDIKDNARVIVFLRQGGRMTAPSLSPPSISSLMEACWQADHNKRPTFRDICKVLHDVLHTN